MFSFSKDQVTHGLISVFMLAAMVFGFVDACLARVAAQSACLPDDQSRVVFASAALLGFLLAAFWSPDE